MHKLVILRHGESVWNKKNLFTGWVDVGLSKKGRQECRGAGQLLAKNGFQFDLAFCSVLRRAKQTFSIVLKELGQPNLPVVYSWRLNERHYGELQGKNKKETAKQYGLEQVHLWRRSYTVRPPALTEESKYYPGRDPLYKDLKQSDLPLSESLKDTWQRMLPCWQEEIAPAVKKGRRVFLSAHGSTARGLIKYFDKLTDSQVEKLNVPTGFPLVYELDKALKPIKHYYLGEAERIKQAIEEVAGQVLLQK